MERINLRYWDRERIKGLLPENFVERQISSKFFEALQSEKVIFLYGPRQSGKTSLVGWMINQLLKKDVPPQNINYAVMDFFDLHPLISDTRKLVKLLHKEAIKEERIYLFIDEVQRLENAGLLLKQIYDMHTKIQIIASGSSIIGMKEKIKEYLTGRKVEIVLYPFSFLEFLKAKKALPEKIIHKYDIEKIEEFNELYGERILSLWQEYIRIGGYPEVVLFPEKKEWLYESLFSTYLERDVGNFIREANYQKFQDYLYLIASEIGKIYNRQEISRTIGRDARTIERFENILTTTFILYRITPFYTNIRKELRKALRFYFLDTGLRNFISKNLNELPVKGEILENAVVGEILKSLNTSIHWWRTKGGAEVDIVVIKGKEKIPIEVKGVREKKPKLTRSFISFIENYNPQRAYFVTHSYYERIKYKNTKIYCIPSYMIGFLEDF